MRPLLCTAIQGVERRQMVLRWVAAGVLEAVKGFRRLKGHKEMPKLVAVLRARDQQRGLVKKDAGEGSVVVKRAAAEFQQPTCRRWSSTFRSLWI